MDDSEKWTRIAVVVYAIIACLMAGTAVVIYLI